MTDLLEPLTESEIQTLDEFLLNRFPDEDEMIGRDEGLLNISELDGFLTAIVSGPELAPPSEWLPFVWGDEEPVWESGAGFQKIFSLIIRQMNGIAGELLGAPEEFEPLFMERTVKGETHLIVDDWCGGYLRGASLWFDAWREEAPESLDLLAPIFVFGHKRGWKFLDELDSAEQERSQEQVAPAARAIHRFWLERRPNAAESLRRTSRVGRNEPCPCGSGKKYKRCCLGATPVN